MVGLRRRHQFWLNQRSNGAWYSNSIDRQIWTFGFGSSKSDLKGFTVNLLWALTVRKTLRFFSDFMKHRPTHSENKPHLCTDYGNSFVQPDDQKSHSFTHPHKREISSMHRLWEKFCQTPTAKEAVPHPRKQTSYYICSDCRTCFNSLPTEHCYSSAGPNNGSAQRISITTFLF